MKMFFKKLYWWLFKRGKQCHKACPFCEYYDLCREELER